MRRIDFFAYILAALVVGGAIGRGTRPDPQIVTVFKTVPIQTVITKHECSAADAVKWWNNSDLLTAKKQLCGGGK